MSLCDRDNPGKIKSPSSTQVHGTILIGVIGGFLALLILFRVASAGFGPFTAAVAGAATRADGGLDVVISVANAGTRDSGASCRISPGGALTYTDYVFFTDPIPAGETRQFAKSLAPPNDGSALPGRERPRPLQPSDAGCRRPRRSLPTGGAGAPLSACRLSIPKKFVAAPVTSSTALPIIARWNAWVEAMRAASTCSGGTPADGLVERWDGLPNLGRVDVQVRARGRT